MKNLITREDPRDYKLGDGHIMLKGGNPDWTGNYWFKELQKIGDFDNECCVIFGAQESFDAQVDRLIASGSVPQSVVDWFTKNGYMDSINSSDGKPHLHTSERFTAYNTGNGFNGNAGQDPWIALRTFGVVPWTDWPFDETITQAEYFTKPPQALFDKASLFLATIGGKNSIQYHWVYQGTSCPRYTMDTARQTAPLCLGVATNDGWNQDVPTPPAIGTTPNHMVDNINVGEIIFDHYVPFVKTFTLGYPIPQVIQGVVTINPPTPAPTLPPNPTPVQIQIWLQKLVNWLSSLINGKGRETSIKMNTSVNVFLLTAATGLVALGVSTIASNLLAGSIEVVLGIAAFIAYEVFPPSTPTA